MKRGGKWEVKLVVKSDKMSEESESKVKPVSQKGSSGKPRAACLQIHRHSETKNEVELFYGKPLNYTHRDLTQKHYLGECN